VTTPDAISTLISLDKNTYSLGEEITFEVNRSRIFAGVFAGSTPRNGIFANWPVKKFSFPELYDLRTIMVGFPMTLKSGNLSFL